MTARKKRRFSLFRLLLLVIFIVVIYNSANIAKLFYPLHYREQIIITSGENGLDPLFIAAIIRTESGFNPRATSPKGARGLMQIMPDTGDWIAQHMDISPYYPDLLFDPETNIRMGTWYIANLGQEFDNNIVYVLAAYNGGRGNVQKWLKENTISGSTQDINAIPFPETKNFVRKVTRDYYIYRWLYQKEINGHGG